MSDYRAHVFICTHEKVGKPSCGAKGSAELRDRLKKMSKDEVAWTDKVRINNSGCLGECEHGIACVIYPKGHWLTELVASDDQKVINAINQSLL